MRRSFHTSARSPYSAAGTERAMQLFVLLPSGVGAPHERPCAPAAFCSTRSAGSSHHSDHRAASIVADDRWMLDHRDRPSKLRCNPVFPRSGIPLIDPDMLHKRKDSRRSCKQKRNSGAILEVRGMYSPARPRPGCRPVHAASDRSLSYRRRSRALAQHPSF
jgi:hypothetical protein